MLKTIKRIMELCGSYRSRLIIGIVCSMFYSIFNSLSIFAILNILWIFLCGSTAVPEERIPPIQRQETAVPEQRYRT